MEQPQHGVERVLLTRAGLERLVPAEAGRNAKRLATVLAQTPERADQELLVGYRLADIQ